MKKYEDIIFLVIILIINFNNLSAQSNCDKAEDFDKYKVINTDYQCCTTFDTLIQNHSIMTQEVNIDIQIPINGNYLYGFAPYPLPAKEFVSSFIVWDSKLDINDAQMNIFDINSNKICGKEKIILNKQTENSGIVTWTTNTVIKGIYFIQIKHGTATLMIKVMIE